MAKVLEQQYQFLQWIFRVDFLWDWLTWYPCCPRDFQECSPAPQFKNINSSVLSFLYGPTLWLLEKLKLWLLQAFVGKVMSLLYNVLSRFLIVFLPRRKCLLISWLQSLSVVILDIKKIKSVTTFICFLYLPWSDETGCHDLSFFNVVFQASLSFSYFTLIKRLFSFSLISVSKVLSSAYLMLLIFLLEVLILAWNSSSPASCMMYSA